jgi:hypothetical protein
MPSQADPSLTRILFIGNSYTSRNQLPRLIAQIAAGAEHPRRVDVDSIVAGGASLKRHWNAGVAQKSLETTPWNFVVLQEQSTLPLKNAKRYHENVRLFAPEIAKRGARTVLYLTWSRQQSPTSQGDLTRAVEEIGAEIKALVVPVGPAWHTAMQENAGLNLYVDDGSHPSTAGSYLAACVFFASLFDEPPRDESVFRSLQLDGAIAARLQKIAWDHRAGGRLAGVT